MQHAQSINNNDNKQSVIRETALWSQEHKFRTSLSRVSGCPHHLCSKLRIAYLAYSDISVGRTTVH